MKVKDDYFATHRDDFQGIHLTTYLQHLTAHFTSTSSSTETYTFFLLGTYHSDFITTWFQCQLPTNTKMHVFEPLQELYVFVNLFLQASHPTVSTTDFVTQPHVDIYLHNLGIANHTSLMLKDDFPITKVPPKISFDAFQQHQRTSSTGTSLHLPLPSIQLPVTTLPHVIEQINHWPKVNLDQLHHFPNSNSSYYKQFPAIPQVTYMSIHMPGMESTIIQGMELHNPSNQEMFPMFHVKLSGSRGKEGHWDHMQLLQHLHAQQYSTYLVGKLHLLPVYTHELDALFQNTIKSKWADVYLLAVQPSFAPKQLMDFIHAYSWADEFTLQAKGAPPVKSFAEAVPTCPKVLRKKRVHANSANGNPVSQQPSSPGAGQGRKKRAQPPRRGDIGK